MFRAASLLLVVLFTLSGCDTIVRQVVAPAFSVGYHMSRGMRFYQDRQYDAALVEFNHVLGAEPDNNVCLEARAATYIMLRNPKAAIVDLDHLEKVAPKNSATKFWAQIIAMRAYAERSAGDNSAATLDYERLIRYKPTDVSLRAGVANMFFGQGKISAAIAMENAAIKIAPRSATLYNDRCFYRAATPDLASALADCNVALQQPHIPGLRLHTLSSRALVYLKLGQPANAIADCNAALRIAPSDPDSLYLRGFAEEQINDASAARRDIAAGLAKKPSMTREYAAFAL